MIQRFLAIITCTALCFLSPAQETSARDILFGPLLTYETQGQEKSLCALGPLVEVADGFFAIRPFTSHDTPSGTTTFLYPLGKATPDGSYFIPFMRRDARQDHERFDLFPFFSGTSRGKSYWGVFPLYGSSVDRLGYDEAVFVLWPLYARTTKEGKDTYSFAWPFFSYSPGSLVRFFPFYGHESSREEESYFVLWPIFHRQRGPDRTVTALLPLFRFERGIDHYNGSLLWPLFTINNDHSLRHTSIDAPWPIIRFARGAYTETRIFPLFWEKDEGPSYHMRSILWPLWNDTTSVSQGMDGPTEERTKSILILNRFTNTSMPGPRSSGKLTVWPLFHATWDERGYTWSFPAVIPLYGDACFDATWGAMLTLAQFSREGASSRVNILWKTLFWEHDDKASRWWLSCLVSRSTSDTTTTWGFLGNLLSFTSGETLSDDGR